MGANEGCDNPGKIVNKARLYNQLVESGDPVSARQIIPILVKYSRMMNNLFAEIQKVVPPGGTPQRVLYQGPPGSPPETLYEEVGRLPSCKIRPRLHTPANKEVAHGQRVPEKLRKILVLCMPDGRVSGL